MIQISDISLELCEFIGALIGDGYIGHYNKSYFVKVIGDQTLDEEYLCSHIPRLVRICFPNLRPKLFYRTDENTLVLSYYSKKLVFFLLNIVKFPVGKKSDTIAMPQIILDADKKFIFATIRGIFDTDGCIFFDKRKVYRKPYPRITLQTNSKPLYIQLKNILSEYFSLYTQESKHKATGKDKFYIEVYGHKQLKRWMSLIGFSNIRHLNKINASVA
ncbi:LAGLIDADG family homing endonuclease [Candidatus Woesearchaeota archaeon]|nr:LAGLIDADG family homing endonuclease [Candidatus Woesearchaeota archaeon]